ncbi:hypothetical protein ACLGIH_20375 [Streptomyces sp. HMX87]|uniref:hypothetical protein n=1 Tax=Streptomyces sp. HMX87 TaxID=3390849 RepID=UPI003A8A0F3F
MTYKIIDTAGQTRTFLELGTALALAAGPIEATDENGRTVVIDPAEIGGQK